MKFNFSLILFLLFSTTLLAQKKKNNEFGATLGKCNFRYSVAFKGYNNNFQDYFNFNSIFYSTKNKRFIGNNNEELPITQKQFSLPEIYFNKKIYKNFRFHFANQYSFLKIENQAPFSPESFSTTWTSYEKYYLIENTINSEIGIQYYWLNKKKINFYSTLNYKNKLNFYNHKFQGQFIGCFGGGKIDVDKKGNYSRHGANLKTGFVLNPYKNYSVRFEITDENLFFLSGEVNFSARIQLGIFF